MKTIVLGGGIVGMASAYYLAKEGHDVTVVDRASEPATEASATNAGLIAPGHSFAWASPAAPKMLMKSLFGEKTAIRVRLKPDLRLYTWGLKFLRECDADRARRNTLIKLRLCQYSQGLLNEVAEEESIDYNQMTNGMLYVYRDADELKAGAEKMKLLQDRGQKQEILDPDAVADVEPTFEPLKDKIAGAIYGLTDSSGECAVFTRRLMEICEERWGSEFLFNTSVDGLIENRDRIVGVKTGAGDVLTADNYVVSLGTWSPMVVKDIGYRLPIYPAKGYSVTFPVKNPDSTPQVGGVDEATLVAWCRMGDRLRMSSTAEFCGYDKSWKPEDFSNILAFAHEWFPDAADYNKGSYHACFRPMTPDGPPIIGKGHHANLWFNTGQGHMGWTMGCGSGRLLADLMIGKQPEISTEGFEVRT